MTLRFTEAKIVATIGPASSSRAILEQMISAGMSFENLERGFKRCLGEGVRVVADEQRAVRTCLAPVVTDRLRVESARNTSLSRSRHVPGSASATRTTERGCTSYIAWSTEGALCQGSMS